MTCHSPNSSELFMLQKILLNNEDRTFEGQCLVDQPLENVRVVILQNFCDESKNLQKSASNLNDRISRWHVGRMGQVPS